MRKFALAALAAAVMLAAGPAAAQKTDAETPAMVSDTLRQLLDACIAQDSSREACLCGTGYFLAIVTDQDLEILAPVLPRVFIGEDLQMDDFQMLLTRARAMGLSNEEIRAIGLSLQEKGARLQAESARLEAHCAAVAAPS
ncbi:MAG: hypothetical protein AB7O04_06885 [Hyphomonadaceae bacterium]